MRFNKKDKSKEGEAGVITYNEKTPIDNGLSYFITDILPTNDTTSIKEIMKNRQYAFNKQFVNPLIDNQYLTPNKSLLLLIVIENCNKNTLKFFLDNGANPNLRVVHKVVDQYTGKVQEVYYSRFPLEVAALAKDTAKMNLLISHGANINIAEKAIKDVANDPYRSSDLSFVSYINDLYGGKLAKDALIKLIMNSSFREKITPGLIAEYVKKGADINATDGETGNF